MTNHPASESSLDQLAVLAGLHDLLQDQGIPYWLFGGWAVDFHAGVLTRPHGDIDIAVWLDDRDRIAKLLEQQRWAHTPDAEEDGYTCFTHDDVRLEVAFLARDENGRVYTPVRDGRGEWPDQTFGDDVVELLGVRAHVIRLVALVADKSVARNDPSVCAKDRADLMSLGRRPA